ncbi:hypothetical protein [Nocardia sp. NPDC050435]|uniref:hypothetical protein n=1 Tax=Nocardia sp. NPDC050435 TaxID=3155040 RepID=UPI00340878DD
MTETPKPRLSIWDWDEPAEISISDGSNITVHVRNGHARLAVTDASGTTVEVPLDRMTASNLRSTVGFAGADSRKAHNPSPPWVEQVTDASRPEPVDDELFEKIVTALDNVVGNLDGIDADLLRELRDHLSDVGEHVVAEIMAQERERAFPWPPPAAE